MLSNMGVTRGGQGPVPPNFWNIQSFCALRSDVPSKILLLAESQLPIFWAGYAAAFKYRCLLEIALHDTERFCVV